MEVSTCGKTGARGERQTDVQPGSSQTSWQFTDLIIHSATQGWQHSELLQFSFTVYFEMNSLIIGLVQNQRQF